MALSYFISDLQRVLGTEKVFTAGSHEYKQGLKRWASSIEKPAGVVVYPTSPQDVATSIKLAAQYSIPLTSVCGGHGTSGDSSTDGGLLINLRRLNHISVSTTSNPPTLTCGGGSLWCEIDVAAAQHSLSLVGGTVNNTGVAGYTTGGGFGWLSGRYGLAIDNLLSAEIVLADGRITTCSATSEPDLFWAVRGAGHMFGIITSFTFRAHPQPDPVYGGMVVFPPSGPAISHMITFANKIQQSSDGRTAMFCGFTTPAFMPGKRIIFACCFHDGPASEGSSIFAPLLADAPVPPIRSTLASMPYPAMNEVLAMAASSEGRRVSKGASYQGALPPRAFERVLELYEDFVANACPEAGESGACLFEFYPLDKVCGVGAREMAFVNRARHSNAMIIPRWRSERYDPVCREFTRTAMEELKRVVREENGRDQDGQEELEGLGEYCNYDGLGTRAERTFGVNFERLVELKTRYDPANVFDKTSGVRASEGRSKTEKEREAPLEKKTRLPHSADELLPLDGTEEDRSTTSPSSTAPTTPTSDTVSGPRVTHEIVISAKPDIDEGSSRTEDILKEVRNATAKMQGVNVVVTMRPLATAQEEDR